MSQQNPKYKYLIEEKQITLYADKVVLVESERFKQVTVNEWGTSRRENRKGANNHNLAYSFEMKSSKYIQLWIADISPK